jgi:tetratricopeptide (TPR) repeat protein
MTTRKRVGWLLFAVLLVLLVLQLPRVASAACFLGGVKFYSSGNYRAAANALEASVRLNPHFARAYVELGSSYRALKNYRKAEQAFLKARSIDDESCASCGLGMTYFELQRYDDAENAFKRSINLNPDDVCPHYQSGRMYYELGKYQEAITTFERVVRLQPSYGAFMYIGNAHVYAREFEASLAAYKQAIVLSPRNATAHRQLGIAYDYLTRYGEAVEEYKQAVLLDPEDATAHYDLARGYLELRNRPAALSEYELLRKLDAGTAAELLDDSLWQGRVRGKEKLYLVPLGSFPPATLDKLVAHYKQKTGVEAIPMEPIPLALSTIDRRRKQVIAEEAIALMTRTYPKLAEDPNAIVIGLTADDIYAREKSWQFAFCYRLQGRFAVVSSARLDPLNLGESANEELLERRLRKIVLKNIGILYYWLPTNHNPQSVLYDEVNSVEDVDKMGENF